MIEFRRASIQDAERIVKTRQKAWEATYRGIYPDEMLDEFDFEQHTIWEKYRFLDKNFHCELVMDADICVGYFSYGKIRAGEWKDFTFRLHSLYLLPEYQGMGLGRKIFSQVYESCLKLGKGRMYLDCHPANKKALAFYRHMGGMITYTSTGHVNPCEDVCHVEFNFTKGE